MVPGDALNVNASTIFFSEIPTKLCAYTRMRGRSRMIVGERRMLFLQNDKPTNLYFLNNQILEIHICIYTCKQQPLIWADSGIPSSMLWKVENVRACCSISTYCSVIYGHDKEVIIDKSIMITIVGLFTSVAGKWISTIVEYGKYTSLIYLIFNFYVIYQGGNSYYLRLFCFSRERCSCYDVLLELWRPVLSWSAWLRLWSFLNLFQSIDLINLSLRRNFFWLR